MRSFSILALLPLLPALVAMPTPGADCRSGIPAWACQMLNINCCDAAATPHIGGSGYGGGRYGAGHHGNNSDEDCDDDAAPPTAESDSAANGNSTNPDNTSEQNNNADNGNTDPAGQGEEDCDTSNTTDSTQAPPPDSNNLAAVSQPPAAGDDSSAPPPAATAPPNPEGKKGPDVLPFNSSTVTITQTAGDADLAGTSDISKEMLEYHNQFRAMYGAAPLTWDAGLAASAQAHAAACEWSHDMPQAEGKGNNIHMAYKTGSNQKGWLAHLTLDGYAIEYKDYDWDNPRVMGEPKVGHFTQMLWKETTKVGCAWNFECDPSKLMGGGSSDWEESIFSSCWYDPAGNNADVEQITANVGVYTGV